MSFAKHFFSLSAVQSDGTTLRAHLTSLAKRGRKDAQESLQGPECPSWLSYLWSWFLGLHARRGSGMNGPARITWQDIDAWSRITGTRLSKWECDVLLVLDAAFFASIAPGK